MRFWFELEFSKWSERKHNVFFIYLPFQWNVFRLKLLKNTQNLGRKCKYLLKKMPKKGISKIFDVFIKTSDKKNHFRTFSQNFGLNPMINWTMITAFGNIKIAYKIDMWKHGDTNFSYTILLLIDGLVTINYNFIYEKLLGFFK